MYSGKRDGLNEFTYDTIIVPVARLPGSGPAKDSRRNKRSIAGAPAAQRHGGRGAAIHAVNLTARELHQQVKEGKGIYPLKAFSEAARAELRTLTPL